MKYRIFSIQTVEVCVPSKDYYGRGNDWSTEPVHSLSFCDECDTEMEAQERIKNYMSGEYTILPVLKIV